MASESSAVLQLTDGDTTETEAGSIADDRDAVPLIMEHGYDIAVKVDAPMKQLSTLETFVTYRVRCVCARWPTPPYVRRRYNHFKVLHKRLSTSHPLIAAPPLPPLHSARQQLDRYSPAFVAVRALALDVFLDRVAKHPILTHSEDFRIFLTTPDDELDKIFKSENSALNLWGLSSALYGSGESKPANGARVKDPEFTTASDYLQSLQQKLTTLCTLTTKLYKGSTALGTELMGMKRACDAWSCQCNGRVSRAASAAASGAAAAAAARGRTALRHRATLPLLAAYAGAHVEKIRQRDAVHSAYVSGNNSTDELHNRLEQASEALRSELSDWIPKTRTEIKSLLLELADRQVNIHTQTLMGWEHALKLSTEANVDVLFKTVSKTAVQNLSPSKCRPDTPNETEKDFDGMDFDNDSNEDSDAQDLSKIPNDDEKNHDRTENSSDIVNITEIDRNGGNSDRNDTNFDQNDGNFVRDDRNIDESSDLPENPGVLSENSPNMGSMSKEESENTENGSKLDCNVSSDPLQDFSEVDLST